MKHSLQALLMALALSGGAGPAAAQQLMTEKGALPLVPQTVNQYRQAELPDFGLQHKQYVLLSFQHILTANQRNAIEASGIQLKDWYPGNSYVAKLPDWSQNMDALQDLSSRNIIPLSSINDLPAGIKTSVSLSELSQQGALSGKDIMISVYDKADLSLLTNYLEQAGLKYAREEYCGANALIVRELQAVQLEAITNLSFVASAELYAGAPEEEWAYKLFSNQVLRANYDYHLGAIGNGVYFGNYETFGVDTNYDFNMRGRQHPLFPGTGVNGHGTSCAAIVGAANNYDEFEDRGMAPGVTSLYVGWYDMAENLYLNNNVSPMVSNHSVGWGAGQVSYSNDARELDRITRTLGGYLHSYSAGNSGDSGPFNGYAAGWANLTGNIKANKNNFTVHASAAPGAHHDWTNKGPTADGRLKPDVCAEGGEGSSYASPGVMGLAAILFEVYNTTYSTTIPRSDVVKAVILNTAYDIDKKGIDFKTGFGTINPIRAKRAIEQQHIMTGTMPQGTGGTAEYTIAVPSGISEAKFMLYWHDYQGAVGAAKALVNNLDLYLLSPVGDTIRPWVLNPTPATVYDLPQRKIDTLNNVEQVTIDNPVAGNYTVHIGGTAVPQGPQNYAVTYDFLPYEVEITSPVAGYRIPKGKSLMITWNIDNDLAAVTDSLEVYLQRSSSESFTQLATLAYDRRYFEYPIPASFPNSASARVVVKQRNQTIADTSDYFHVMTTPVNLTFTRLCADTIGLQWDTVAANSGGKYIIYRLGNKYMEPVDSVLHPVRNINLSAINVLGAGQQWTGTEYFAVAARHANGALSVRTLPISTMPTDPLGGNNTASNTLCYGDTAKLTVGALQNDSVQWYRASDSTLLATTDTFLRTMQDAGTYFFKTFLNGCVYSSPVYTVNSGAAVIADTALWGNFKWLISSYKGGSTASTPFYGANPKYYGKFSTDSLGFNSNDYYSWYSSGPHNAPGYQGCSFTSASDATTVYKRQGFAPGTYQINLLRAAGKLKMTINNGTVTQYTSPNNAFTTNNIWTGVLDANSTIRVEAFGSHNNIQIVPIATPLPTRLKRFEATALSNDHVQLDFVIENTSPDVLLSVAQGNDARNINRIVSSMHLSEGTNAYQVIDEYPANGINYYRLTWKNSEGSILYSPVLLVKINADEAIKVYPTVTHDGNINLQLGSAWEQATCKVLNMAGQEVDAMVSGTGNARFISLKSLSPGVYLITVKDQDRRMVYKVVYQP